MSCSPPKTARAHRCERCQGWQQWCVHRSWPSLIRELPGRHLLGTWKGSFQCWDLEKESRPLSRRPLSPNALYRSSGQQSFCSEGGTEGPSWGTVQGVPVRARVPCLQSSSLSGTHWSPFRSPPGAWAPTSSPEMMSESPCFVFRAGRGLGNDRLTCLVEGTGPGAGRGILPVCSVSPGATEEQGLGGVLEAQGPSTPAVTLPALLASSLV